MRLLSRFALAGVLAMTLAGGVASAQNQPADSTAPEGAPPRRQRLGPPPQEILDKYDANKDGKLDEEERAILHKDVADGKVQPPRLARRPHGPDGGPDGEFQPPAGERPFPTPPSPKELIGKYDADKDGKLDETELAAMIKDIPHRPPPMAAGRGPGRGPRPPLDGEGPQGNPQP